MMTELLKPAIHDHVHVRVYVGITIHVRVLVSENGTRLIKAKDHGELALCSSLSIYYMRFRPLSLSHSGDTVKYLNQHG